MGEETKSVGRLAAVLGVVLLLIIAAVRFFGGSRTLNVGDLAAENDESPYVIRSIPSHAEVYINNSYAGVTPHRYESFDAGVLRIRLEHSDLAPVETLLIVPEDDPVPIFPVFVFSIPVELSSLPVGAQPVVNGRALRPFEIASYSVAATDTLEVAFKLGGEASKPVRFNPLIGLIDNADTVRWHWRPTSADEPARLTGVFAKQIRVSSEPPGAEVYLDNNPVAIGRTNGRVAVPYGDHLLTLRLPPFDDHVVAISAGRDRNEPVSAVLRRTVWLAAVDERNPYTDLNARVTWVRQGGRYVVNPDDGLVTPSNIVLEGRPSEIQVSCPGYADTTIILAALASEVTIEMRLLPRRRQETPAGDEGELAWVRFVVKQGRKKGLAGAEVFGIDKGDGQIVRYGPTDADGMLTTRVPVGDYDWWAAKEGFAAGKPNGERVKRGRKTKEITLKVKPR